MNILQNFPKFLTIGIFEAIVLDFRYIKASLAECHASSGYTSCNNQ